MVNSGIINALAGCSYKGERAGVQTAGICGAGGKKLVNRGLQEWWHRISFVLFLSHIPEKRIAAAFDFEKAERNKCLRTPLRTDGQANRPRGSFTARRNQPMPGK